MRVLLFFRGLGLCNHPTTPRLNCASLSPTTPQAALPPHGDPTQQIYTPHRGFWHGQVLLPAFLLGQGAEAGASRHAYAQRSTQAAHQGFHWRDGSCHLFVTLFMGSAGRLAGLRNSTRYPNAIVLQGKRWSHCEHAVLLPKPSGSWIHPSRAVNSLVTPKHTTSCKEVLTL